MHLLDTDVTSELRKIRLGRADRQVVDWFRYRPLSSLYLSVVTILELRQGVVSLLNRDPPQAAIYQTWLRYVLEAGFSTRLLPVDVEVALRCAELHTRQPKSYRDSLIAATALVNNLTVVTRNVKDFAPMGVRVINPWE